MTKIMLRIMSSSDCRTYRGPSGKSYDFYKEMYADVDKAEDALHFLNAGDGTVFESKKPIAALLKSLKSVVKSLKKEKDIEDDAPEETGKLEPTDEEIEKADGEIAPIDGEEPTEEMKEREKEIEEKGEVTKDTKEKEIEEEKKERNLMDYQDLVALNRKQQRFLIKKIQGEDAKIPSREKGRGGRVELLLKLQEEGADIHELLKGYE